MTDFTNPQNQAAPTPSSSIQPAPQQNSSKIRPIGEYVKLAWNDFTRQPLLILGLMLAPVILQLAVAMPANFMLAFLVPRDSHDAGVILPIILLVIGSVIGIGNWVAQVYLGVCYRRAILSVAAGQDPSFGDAVRYDPRLVYAFLTQLLSGFIIIAGMLCLILPGIILAFMLALAPSFVLVRNDNPIDAIKSSFQLVKDNFGDVFLLFLTGFGISILGLLACGVGLFVAVPVVSLMFAHLYFDLTKA